MPRKTRMYIPGIPAHIVQRGNNRQATFFDDDDYQFYLEVLKEGAGKFKEIQGVRKFKGSEPLIPSNNLQFNGFNFGKRIFYGSFNQTLFARLRSAYYSTW